MLLMRRNIEKTKMNKLAMSNYDKMHSSGGGFCYFCFNYVSTDHINHLDCWLPDKNGATALCYVCSVDSVVPTEHIMDDGNPEKRLEMLIETHKEMFSESTLPKEMPEWINPNWKEKVVVPQKRKNDN